MSLKKIARSLVANEIWIVALSVGIGVIFPRWLPVAILISLVFWPLRWWVTGKPGRRTPADIPVILLVLMIPVTMWATAIPDITLPQVFRLVAGICLFYAVTNSTTSLPRLRLLFAGMLLLALALTVLAPIGVEWLTTKYPIIPDRIFDRLPLLLSDPANPNVMAGYLILFIPLALGLALFAWRDLSWYERLLTILVVSATTIVTVLTQSRGAWLGLLLAIFILFLFRWRRLGLILLVLVIGLGIGLYFWRSGAFFTGLLGAGQLVSLEGRLEVWSRAIYMVQDFSITGVGMGLYMNVTDLLYPFFLFATGTIEHAHNLFLQIAVDLGIIGLIAWLSALLTIIYTAWRVYRTGSVRGQPVVAALGAGLLASQVALVGHGLTDAVTWGMVRPAPLVWALWGMVVASGLLFLPSGGSDR